MADKSAGRSSPAGSDPDEAELRARLQGLADKLERAKPSHDADPPPRQGEMSGSALGRALKLSSELIAGVLVGGGLGYGLDQLAGTRPWGLIVFVMIGFAAGVMNLVRSAGLSTTGKRSDSSDRP